jgi:hypothetical protein
MHLKVLRDALLVRASNVSATHQLIVLQTIRSGLIGPYETVLAEVVALKLGELRFLQPGGYRSIAAHADGIECPLTFAPSGLPSHALFSIEPCVAQIEYPAKISRRDGLQYQVVRGRYHGEIAEQKGGGTILPPWNRTGALS